VVRQKWQDTIGEIRERGKKLLHMGHTEEIQVYRLQNKQNLRYKSISFLDFFVYCFDFLFVCF